MCVNRIAYRQRDNRARTRLHEQERHRQIIRKVITTIQQRKNKTKTDENLIQEVKKIPRGVEKNISTVFISHYGLDDICHINKYFRMFSVHFLFPHSLYTAIIPPLSFGRTTICLLCYQITVDAGNKILAVKHARMLLRNY